MGKIHILSEDLKNKIAAGEVVERPASVVKELIENSIDAGAKNIDVLVSGGGNASVQVVDDGGGLESDDLKLAFSRHTTSKIESPEDLHRINTLGFRGEALASIASVSKVRAISTVNGGAGSEIAVKNGEISEPVPGSMAEGTLISVTDLFFSVPARRKFLKSAKVELRHVIQVVRRFALSYPEISFRLMADEREILSVRNETLNERIGKVFDPTYRQNILPVDYEKGPFKITGFVGNLNLVRKRGGEQFLFLKSRYIVDKLLNSAVYSAFRSLVSRGEFPFFVLNLEAPLDQVDVNVHPMKIEVRFQDEWRVYHTLKSAVETALTEIISTIPDLGRFESSDTDFATSRQDALSFKRTGESEATVGMQTVERAKEYVRSIQAQPESSEFVNLESIWQVHAKYIVSEIKSGLVVIDQHVAHERILFDKAIEALEGSPLPSQTLLFPEVVELPADDFSALIDLLPFLEKIGFRMKEFGKHTVLVEGVPSEMGWGNIRDILKDILDSYETEKKEHASFQEAVAASFACHAAVKAGDVLTKDEMQSLVDRLFATKHPYYCPHGRPIIVNLSLDELDRRFERN